MSAVVDEAISIGAELLVTHHPLFLRPIHGVAATTPKGQVVHRLLTAGIALHVVHTNADVARTGVSDALADVLGLRDLAPLDPSPAADTDKLVTFVPRADANAVIDAMAAAGAGTIGDYERCTWSTEGIGSFRPLPGARPSIGSVGTIEQVPEVRVEMVLPRSRRGAIVGAAGRASVRGTGLRRVRAGHAAKSVGPGPCRASRSRSRCARSRPEPRTPSHARLRASASQATSTS